MRLSKNLNAEFDRFNEFLNEIEVIAHKVGDLKQITPQYNMSHHNNSIEQLRINNVINQLVKKIIYSHQKIKAMIVEAEQHKLNQKQKAQEELSKIALQVAHDIRSPLAALDIVVRAIADLPEEVRFIVRDSTNRINDIANGLLIKGKQQHGGNPEISEQLISNLIAPVISEKRIRLGSDFKVNIESDMDETTYGLFAKVNLSDFKRAISNIINNSIEALSGEGNILVKLLSDENSIYVTITDNGKGIPKEILSKLGKMGETHNKQDGFGLGLYQAQNAISAWGGLLEINSILGEGTTITINLPKIPEPRWFASKIHMLNIKELVILDDDKSIHQVWRKRFKELNTKYCINIISFTSPEQLKNWYKTYKKNNQCLILCDYEFIGFDINGLDIIAELGINQMSILVTSRFDEESIREHCEQLGVKLIPKNLASIVPIIEG